MSLVSIITKIPFMTERFMLQIWPPFLFMGVRVLKVAPDYKELHLKLPVRWYAKNMHGTLFGGFICAVADPLPTLLCERLFPGYQVWTKRNAVEFLRPARSTVDLRVEVTDADIQSIRESLDQNGQALHTFEYVFRDRRGHVIAEVLNTIYLRRRLKTLSRRSN